MMDYLWALFSQIGLPEATGSRATSGRTGVFDDRLFT